MNQDNDEYVAYYRVSTRKQGESGLGLEAQHTYINHFYKDKKIIAEFTDISSGDIKNRDQLQAALTLCKKRGATLIVAKVDRLSRNTEQALRIYRELDERLESCDIPNLDKFTLTLFLAVADRERKLISIRTKAALLQKVKRNSEWRAGSMPFRSGYASKLGTATVQRIARQNTNSRQAMAQIRLLMVGEGSYTQIARQLNEDGFRAPRGGRYSAMQVNRLCYRIQELNTSQAQGMDIKS